MKNLIREPLVQFLLLGAVLFVAFDFIGQWNLEKPSQIVVDPKQIDVLRKGFKIDFNHEPTSQDTDKLIDDFIREEVFVHEAVKLNLHLENQKVRMQLRQLMEDEYSSIPVPTDLDLERFLEQHPDKFRAAPDKPVPPLSEIKPTVRNVWQATKRKEAIDAAFQGFLKQYNVVIQRPTSPATSTAAQ